VFLYCSDVRSPERFETRAVMMPLERVNEDGSSYTTTGLPVASSWARAGVMSSPRAAITQPMTTRHVRARAVRMAKLTLAVVGEKSWRSEDGEMLNSMTPAAGNAIR
jgi:hypothetical protein